MLKLKINRIDKDLTEYLITSETMDVSLLNLGATLRDVSTIDRCGKKESVTLKWDTFEQYKNNDMFLGTTVGAYAGRIAGGQFTYEGKVYKLETNDGQNTLHYGSNGFHKKYFDVSVIAQLENSIKLCFETKLTSLDDGLDGVLNVKVLWTITPNKISSLIETTATSIRLSNPTNHTYWNLSGGIKESIETMTIEAPVKYFWVNDKQNTPQKPTKPKGALNFTKTKLLKTVLKDRTNGLLGIDNAFELNYGLVVLTHPASGRKVEITSSANAAVIYTQNYGTTCGISEHKKDSKHLGVAIEFQNVPNDVNRHDWSSVIKPGETKKHEITFSFGTISKKAIL